MNVYLDDIVQGIVIKVHKIDVLAFGGELESSRAKPQMLYVKFIRYEVSMEMCM